MIDEELYQLATKELNSEHRLPDLWARAVALASDDHDEARFLYTNLRVEQLIAARDAGEPMDLPAPGAPEFTADTSTEPDTSGLTANLEAADIPDSELLSQSAEKLDAVLGKSNVDTKNLTLADQHPALDLTDDASNSRTDFQNNEINLEETVPGHASTNATAPDIAKQDVAIPDTTISGLTLENDPQAESFIQKNLQKNRQKNGLTNAQRTSADSETPDLATVDASLNTLRDSDSTTEANISYQHGTIKKDAEAAQMSPEGELSMDDSIRTASLLTEPAKEPTGIQHQSAHPDEGIHDHGGIHDQAVPGSNATLPSSPADMTIAEAQELHQASLEHSIETDQTVRLDHGPGSPLPDIPPHELTTNQTLNPAEENDGDINPKIDLDDLANRSATEVNTVVGRGSRFYSIFNHVDGRTRAVKLGASWPAFFFTLPWLLYKKLWGTAIVYIALLAVLLVAFVTLGLQFLDADATLSLSTRLVTAGFAILAIVGMFYLPLRYGNRWVESRLERKGFTFSTALAADTAAQACQYKPS